MISNPLPPLLKPMLIEDALLYGLVEEQLMPWAGRLRPASLPGRLSQLAAQAASIYVFTLDGSEASFAHKQIGEKPPPALSAYEDRAGWYETLLCGALQLQPLPRPLTIAIDVGDGARNDFDVPVFSFQKTSGDPNPLLPDVELVSLDFLEAVPEDQLPFEMKHTQATFAGSTTGGGIISMEAAVTAAFPRLRAAEFFRDVDTIDFRLSRIVQCASPEVEAYLRGRGYGEHLMDWPETYQSKFGISMDGNGAACSRPAILLRSNSALLKYRSSHELYYTSALKSGSHFIAIHDDQEVIRVVQEEAATPGRYAAVAAGGRAFAARVLSRAAVLSYTAELISAYQALAE